MFGKLLMQFVESKAGYYLWLGAMVVVLAVSLYASHLRVQRDTARAEVATLTQQLATERAVSEGLAQVAKDAANQTSAQASAQLVQKNREITAQNSSLKKEIKNVYANTASTLAQTYAVGTGAIDTNWVDGRGGNADACFGVEFGRLWNAANTLRSSETAAP